MSNQDNNRDKLIAAVYSATLSPDYYDDILDTIDELVFSGQADAVHSNPESSHVQNGSNGPVIDPNLLVHFKRAYDVQIQMGRKKSDKPIIQVLLDAAPNPAFIFDQSENIIAMNSLATDKLLEESELEHHTKLQDCCTNKHILEKIRKFARNGKQEKWLVEPGYVNAQQDMNTCILVKTMDGDANTGASIKCEPVEKLFFFTIVNLGFDASKADLFRSAYKLTPAELDIAVHLASGKQLPEIAAERSAGLATIRTQIKAIKRKTNTRDVPAIVRLLCGFSAGILISSQLSNTKETLQVSGSPLKSYHQIKLRDGRNMAYLEQGDPKGIPVIIIHSMPYGVELPQDAVKVANRMGLRIISPYRPGYGNSDLLEGMPSDELLSASVAGTHELLHRLALPKATIVGVGIGSIYAMRFASLYPNKVSHLFAVSHTPMWRDAWMAQMSKRQRLIMRITKYMPQLLPLVIRATVAYIDKGRAQDLFRTVCADSAADTLALKKTKICELMEREFVEGLKQGAKAVRRDCFLAITDFSQEAKRLKHKFHVIHGDDDKVVLLHQAKAFADYVPDTELEIVKVAGALLIYSHWERVLQAIKKKHKNCK